MSNHLWWFLFLLPLIFRLSITYLCLWAFFSEPRQLFKNWRWYINIPTTTKVLNISVIQEKKIVSKTTKIRKVKKPTKCIWKAFLFHYPRDLYADKKKAQRCMIPISNSACYSVFGAAPATSDLCENLCWQAPWVSKLNVALECF